MADEISTGLAQAARERAAREREANDPRWQKLVRGDLSPQEEAALRTEAQAPGASERARRGYAAFRPLDADFRARMTATIGRELASQRERPSAGESKPAKDGLDQGAGEEPAERHTSFGRPLLAAAAILVTLIVPWSMMTRDEPLPAYSVEISGAAQETRATQTAANGQPLIFNRHSRLRVLLTPEDGVRGDIATRVYLLHDDSLDRIELVGEPSEEGVVLLEGLVGERLAPRAGRSVRQLVIVVGRPPKLPSAAELEAFLGREDPAQASSWQLFTQEVRFDPDT